MPDVSKRHSARLNAVAAILTSESVASQDLIVQRLREQGFDVTQSSVSRDLRQLRVAKVGGMYILPNVNQPLGTANQSPIMSVHAAGDNLLVLKTRPGAAQMVAHYIDGSNYPEVIGTVAGDDTLFVAVGSLEQQRSIMDRLPTS